MMFNVKSTGLLTVSVALIATLAGCGAKSSKDSGTATATAADLAGDPQLQSSVVNASHGDTVTAAADQSSSGAGLMLRGKDDSGSSSSEDDDHDKSSVSKSCALSGSSAVVTISSAIDEAKTSTSKSGTVTNTRTRTGSSTMTRTWSRTDGTAVTCNTAGTGANVDFKNPSGLKLDVSIDRSRDVSNKFVGPKLTRTSSKSFSVKGSHAVTWSSNDATGDGSTYVRNKSIVIKDVTRSMTMTNKDGVTLSSTLVMNTTTDKPIVVKVERAATDHSVSSKTFVSGEVVVKKDADATITTTYDNLKLTSECQVESGTATIVITDSAGAVLKTLTLGADSSGDAELKDKKSGSGIDGFALDGCDAEDSKG
jgi:hypothetical protein